MSLSRSRRTGTTRALSLFFAFLLALPSLEGQTILGAILGNVSDHTGAMVPNAKVTVRNVLTGIVREVATDENGYYEASHLPVGRYSVNIEAPAFRRFTRSEVVVEAT
ncbi:MAG: carboxypeptidase-like regulatory domain-containing protein, partial [Acidobacteria bacterium]|nr:carboxypeptidase-like regulatory domain-containing protein [Acidobacteriota bacterium]